ncbi:hypothetical protein EYB53_016445 [Candidatus Chloroploca sp. M-50]|uniref:Glycosyltransferase RgtA/B/C/D-like domain-containing protein n=1 Tax=Candidatus Chloroploca mongolica TaxID=2528176 RepID=A0ABS4DCY8_9CHLR|nr:hypothetical protein [Candidatus Chloroploca mongolica]MBP1467304.1 hypothetical protein [Candidatus Chloroploca mongolica]
MQRDHPMLRLLPQMVRRSLTLDHLWIATLFALIWFFLSVTPLPPNDLWWHMAAGRAMVQEGALITTNRWAYTLSVDAPYVYQSWLSELIMYGVWWLGDVPLLALLRTVVIVLSYAMLTWHAWRRAGDARAVSLALFLVVMVGWNNWTLRPQTLALLPGAAFVVLLEEHRAGRLGLRWLLILLPLVMVVWVNVHGSFILGIVLFALSWLGTFIRLANRAHVADPAIFRRLKELSLVGIAILLAAMINPSGPGIFWYVRSMLNNVPLQVWFIEWQPPQNTINLLSTGFWFYLLLLGLAVLMATGSRRPAPLDLLWYCALAWLTIGGVRYAIWFALILLPLLADRLTVLFPARPPVAGNPRLNALYLSCLLAMLLALLPWMMPARYLGLAHLFAHAGPYNFLLSNTTPLAATAWLEAHPIEGRFWTNMSYTSYTIWHLPDKQVFADLRAELFPVAIWQDYFAISEGTAESLALLDQWQITHLLLPVDDALHDLLSVTPGWCEVYRDQQTTIVARCP